MTKAFNELYEELKGQVVHRSVCRLQKKWEDDCGRDSKEFTTDEVLAVMSDIIDDEIRTLRYDLEHCLDEDSSDVFTEIQETMEEDGFTVLEGEEAGE